MARLTPLVLLLSGLILLIGAAPTLAEKRGVTVGGKAPADYVAEQTGKSWAVVIGINEYRDPSIKRLKYAVADAQAVAKELERRGYQVTLLLNQQATERAINTELRTRLRQRVSKEDRVVVYYAGHPSSPHLRFDEPFVVGAWCGPLHLAEAGPVTCRLLVRRV
ncbi:MAG: caspase family protein [Nitrospira sp.]|nr:caspase family protein [Nitrospira sp.]